MSERFTPDFFAGNRTKLRKLLDSTTPIVLTANGLLQRSGDTTFPFRQDSSFWYFAGIEEPNITLVIDKDKEYLILPELSEYQEVMEVNFDAAEISKTSGIKDVLPHKEGWKKLTASLSRAKQVATLSASPAYIDHYGFYSNPARAALIKKIKSAAENIEFVDLRSQLRQLRMFKQAPEVKAIQEAIDITGEALKTVRTNIDKYKYEYQIEADLNQLFRQKGASGHGFAPIVAGGINATTPHYVANQAPLKPKSIVVVDIGAEVSNYSADITRAFSTAAPTKRQKAVYDAVLEVQKHTLSLVKPGITIRQLEAETEKLMGEELRQLGLIKTNDHKSVRKYYPHSVSHFLGLDVHDIGDYDHPLEAGMVITVEPGIYIDKEAIGVRLEDDILVTEKSHRVLSQKIPKRLW